MFIQELRKSVKTVKVPVLLQMLCAVSAMGKRNDKSPFQPCAWKLQSCHGDRAPNTELSWLNCGIVPENSPSKRKSMAKHLQKAPGSSLRPSAKFLLPWVGSSY